MDRSIGGPFRPDPPSALPEWAMVMGGVMGGAAQGCYNTVRVMYRIVPIQYCNVTYRIVS